MCALDIDNKIIIADMRLVGLHSEVLVMNLYSMHMYVISKAEHALVTRSAFIQCFCINTDVTSFCLFSYSLQQTNTGS